MGSFPNMPSGKFKCHRTTRLPLKAGAPELGGSAEASLMNPATTCSAILWAKDSAQLQSLYFILGGVERTRAD